MIKFSKEPFQIVEDNFHLIKEHWDEVVRDKRPLAPHWDYFRLLEKENGLVCFVVRENEIVVGYAVFVFQFHLHSRDVRIAINDAVFLKKELRKSGLGKSFLEYCDEELEKTGVNMILWHVKPAVDFSPSLKKLGYFHFATVYAKEVGG